MAANFLIDPSFNVDFFFLLFFFFSMSPVGRAPQSWELASQILSGPVLYTATWHWVATPITFVNLNFLNMSQVSVIILHLFVPLRDEISVFSQQPSMSHGPPVPLGWFSQLASSFTPEILPLPLPVYKQVFKGLHSLHSSRRCSLSLLNLTWTGKATVPFCPLSKSEFLKAWVYICWLDCLCSAPFGLVSTATFLLKMLSYRS